MKRLSVIVTLLVALDAVAADEMRKLDFLVGEWQGEAEVRMGPKPEHVLQHEVVRLKAGALLIEGLGKRKLEDGSAGEVVHDALAVVSWNDAAKRYEMQTWVANRPGTTAHFDLPSPNVAVWGFDTPQGGKVRYTIRLDDKGAWNEIGEFSRNGETWSKFFDMTVVKQ